MILKEILSLLNRDDAGASIIEYALLVILIAIVALVGVQAAGVELSQTYSEIGSTLANS